MGRPTGEVFVEFFNNDEAPFDANQQLLVTLAVFRLRYSFCSEAVRAFNDRNFQMMGNRYVESTAKIAD